MLQKLLASRTVSSNHYDNGNLGKSPVGQILLDYLSTQGLMGIRDKWNRPRIHGNIENPSRIIVMLHGLTAVPIQMKQCSKDFLANDPNALTISLPLPGHCNTTRIPISGEEHIYDTYVSNMAQLIRDLKAERPDTPIDIMGLSAGAMLSMRICKLLSHPPSGGDEGADYKSPVNSLTMISPYFNPRSTPGWAVFNMAYYLRVGQALNSWTKSIHAKVGAQGQTVPHCKQATTVGTFNAITQVAWRAKHEDGDLPDKTLCIASREDDVACTVSTRRFFADQHPDATYIERDSIHSMICPARVNEEDIKFVTDQVWAHMTGE